MNFVGKAAGNGKEVDVSLVRFLNYGRYTPEYSKCVDISTRAALRR